MKKEFDYILDGCIERLMKGSSIESVLSEYPDIRDELEPLLRAALDINSLPRIELPAEYIESSRISLLREISRPAESGYDFGYGISSLADRISSFVDDLWQSLTAAKKWSAAVAAVLIIVLVASLGQFVFFAPSPAAASTCVLRILSGEVNVSDVQSDAFGQATDGMDLSAGAQIATGYDSHALITFFDGSTIKLDPETVLEIAQLDAGEQQSPVIILTQYIGETWSSVMSMDDPDSRFEINTPSATAVVHGTLFATRVSPRGDTTVSTTEGLVSVTAEDGEVFVAANHKTEVSKGKKPSEPLQVPEPESEIVITFTGAVVGSVSDPTGSSTGILPDGTEMNQIRRSVSAVQGQDTQQITISDPLDGNYTIALRYLAENTANYHIQGTLNGKVVLNYSGSLNTKKEGGYLVNFDLSVNAESMDISKVQVKTLTDNSPEKTGKVKNSKDSPSGQNKPESRKGNSQEENTPGNDETGNNKKNTEKNFHPGQNKSDAGTDNQSNNANDEASGQINDEDNDNKKDSPPGQDKSTETGSDKNTSSPPGKDKISVDDTAKKENPGQLKKEEKTTDTDSP